MSWVTAIDCASTTPKGKAAATDKHELMCKQIVDKFGASQVTVSALVKNRMWIGSAVAEGKIVNQRKLRGTRNQSVESAFMRWVVWTGKGIKCSCNRASDEGKDTLSDLATRR